MDLLEKGRNLFENIQLYTPLLRFSAGFVLPTLALTYYKPEVLFNEDGSCKNVYLLLAPGAAIGITLALFF